MSRTSEPANLQTFIEGGGGGATGVAGGTLRLFFAPSFSTSLWIFFFRNHKKIHYYRGDFFRCWFRRSGCGLVTPSSSGTPELASLKRTVLFSCSGWTVCGRWVWPGSGGQGSS